MAYSQSKKLTDTEKKLQTLKIQLFGKEHVRITSTEVNKSHKPVMTNLTPAITITNTQHQDLTYLKNDLLKITILAAIALFAQLMLYMQFTFKVLKFN